MSEKLNPKQAPDNASQKPSAQAPTPEDFKGEAVTRAVLKESIQHPATIYPLAGSALALTWTLIVAPSPASLALTLGLAFTSASSFVYNYIVKGPEHAQNYVGRLRELRKQSEVSSLDNLAAACLRAGLTQGAKEARELKAAYEQLADYLKQSSQLPSVDRFSVLAEESLRQGIHTLGQALSVYTAMQSVDIDRLDREATLWRRRLTTLDPQSTEYKTLKTQIDSHTKRIDLFKQSEDKLDQLIAESNEIETALQTTYLELADSGNLNLEDFLREDGSAVNRLNQAVEAAQRVEQRLRGDDTEEIERQQKYIQVDQQNETPGH